LVPAAVRSIGSALVLFLLLALKIEVAFAHHSFAAEFDAARTGQIAGVITHVRFSNPHVRYRIDVPGADGASEEWELQMGSVTALRSRGWGPATLQIGDRIKAQGELGRDGTKKLYVRRIETEQGKVVYGERAASGSRNLVKATPGREYGYGVLNKSAPFDISGAWDNRYKFHVTVDDLEPKPTPFTEEGRRRFEDVTHFDDPALRCLAPGLPRIFGSPYNMEIVDAGTHYLVVHVEHNAPRRIYMDGREAPADWPATSLGYSVGHWDGDALVIETTHLLPGWLDGSGLPMSGDGTRIVERWQLSEDRLTMDRLMTIYDPYYTEPLVRRRGSARGDDVEIIEQGACDPSGYYLDLLESGQLEQRLKR
jgi:hypothetical protein